MAQMRGINVRYINAANIIREWNKDNLKLNQKEEIRRVRPGYIIKTANANGGVGLSFVYNSSSNLVTIAFSENGKRPLNNLEVVHRDFSATFSFMRRYVEKYLKIKGT
ncbi:MAG: hypothetical protein ACTSVC_11940 [Promethearchaeota archaeon]